MTALNEPRAWSRSEPPTWHMVRPVIGDAMEAERVLAPIVQARRDQLDAWARDAAAEQAIVRRGIRRLVLAFVGLGSLVTFALVLTQALR